MAKIARNLDESFGLDISKSDYIDEYVSQKLGKKFRYSPDLAGRYTPEIETAIKEAKDIYAKFRSTPQPLDLIQEAKKSVPMAQKETAKNSIVENLKKKKEVKANLPKTPQVEGKTVDPELLSLQKSQESLP